MTQSIYTILIAKIKATLESVSNIKQVKVGPTSKLDNLYPAAIFVPDDFDNEMLSTAEDFRTYAFKLWTVVNANQISKEDLYETVMPDLVDAVLEQFADDWSVSAIDGHRVWMTITGGRWILSTSSAGEEAVAEFNIQIKLSTNIN